MVDGSLHPAARVRLRREIRGASAVLLPFDAHGQVDWDGFSRHVERTGAAGLTPAVNLDAGSVQELDHATRERVLDVAMRHGGGAFVAGAHVRDDAGARFELDAYRREIESIELQAGLPVVLPSHGLNALDADAWVGAHREIARHCDRFLALELGAMFVPYGKIYGLTAYRGLLDIERCAGAIHGSLSREREWERLALRAELRPEFSLLTGHELAIDMVVYGSDYLLGASTFAPDLFARRDALWAAGDPAFYELNDALQALAAFAFRDPVPAYKHDAAMFLKLRGWIESDEPHPKAQRRPEGDRAVLADFARRLGVLG